MAQAERTTGICASYSGDPKDGACTFTVLSNAMARPENGEISLAGLQQPKAKTGIAFMLAHALRAEPESIEQALAAVEFVIPAVEVSNNGSTIHYVTGGRPVRTNHCDLRTLGVVLEKNGDIAGMGAGAQIHGHPAEAIIAAARRAAAEGESLPAGSIILAAGITNAVDVAAQDNILTRVQDLGSISIRFI